MKSHPNVPATLRTQARYGWIPDLPDKRDQLYSAVYKIPKKLPARVDLRKHCSAVENQGYLGSCTANAMVGVLEFLERKAAPRKAPANLSRLFVYYNERAIEHTTDQDAGAMLRDGIKTLSKQGVCLESLWPYDESRYDRRPNTACFVAAQKHLIASYQRLATVTEMRACLADGYPYVFGFSVYESFESDAVTRHGVVDMPKPDEKMIGGHAVCAVGYDDKAKRFIVRNSWGEDWGMKGCFTMPYAYLDDRNLSDDFWTIRRFDGYATTAKSQNKP
jgi:C1A family cysteine protease